MSENRAYEIQIEQLKAQNAQYKADIIKAGIVINNVIDFLGLNDLSGVPESQRTGKVISKLMQKLPGIAFGGDILKKIGIEKEVFSDILERYKSEIENEIKKQNNE